MLRNMIDEAVKVHTGSPADVGSSDDMVCDSVAAQDKNFILLLHHLPGDTVVNQYPALFLHGWDFWHLDSFASSEQIGSSDKTEGLQMDRWLQAAAPWNANLAAAPPVPHGECDLQTFSVLCQMSCPEIS